MIDGRSASRTFMAVGINTVTSPTMGFESIMIKAIGSMLLVDSKSPCYAPIILAQ
jgi:hypothetical protein